MQATQTSRLGHNSEWHTYLNPGWKLKSDKSMSDLVVE
jgi:hypothetical protein